MFTQSQRPYQHLLVALDFSPSGYAAFARAQSMAAQHSTRISVLHVVELPVNHVLEDNAVIGLPGIWDSSLIESLQQGAQHKMQQLAQQVAHGDLNIHFEMVIGHPADEICQYSTQYNVDCILMGFHGHSPLRALLGSTSHSVLQMAHCDVLNVKQHNKE
ncbi:universal stress protein [Thiosulfatimonas sediminis]|uniref:Universal stress protein n=1 Tax=Thiosulfatimonas sediminis TaxID=2675054 RepID=A0A6F8PUU0_9GAMM|nr:universal stress protein [Thiosulfatimonas sediminis]BBP45912.1 universal stress protein [Thiosulfatimonas sediminis]